MSRLRFREAARDQRVCAVTEVGGRDFHAHHVIKEQELKKRGLDPDDPRNALRLKWKIHLDHHGCYPIPLTALTDENIEFAFEVLGAYADDYLRRTYTGEDPRVRVHGERTGG